MSRQTALELSLVADALSLGPHWIYQAERLSSLYPEGLPTFDAPRSHYHPGKTAGDFTHYGDQALLLLQSLAQKGSWDLGTFREQWSTFWRDSQAYRDGATTDTLKNLEAGQLTGSSSRDLAGAARIAPLIVLPGLSLEDRVQAARAQCAMTHNQAPVLDAAEFFVRATEAILAGDDFRSAFQTAHRIDYPALPLAEWTAKAESVLALPPQEALRQLGLACSLSDAFPAVLAIALQLEERPQECLAQNALAGGDSAARGLLLGLLLGAKHGETGVPSHWFEDYTAAAEVKRLLSLLSPA